MCPPDFRIWACSHDMVGADVLGGPRFGWTLWTSHRTRRAEDVAPYHVYEYGVGMDVRGCYVVGADVLGGPRL